MVLTMSLCIIMYIICHYVWLLSRVKAPCIKWKALKIPSKSHSLLNSKYLTINIPSMEKKHQQRLAIETKPSSMESFSHFSRNWSGGIRAEIFAWFIFLTGEFPYQRCHEARAAVLAPHWQQRCPRAKAKKHPVDFPGSYCKLTIQRFQSKGKGHNRVWDAHTALHALR